MPNESVLLKSNLNTCPCLKRYENVFGDWEQNYQLHSSTFAGLKEGLSFADINGNKNRVSERITFLVKFSFSSAGKNSMKLFM